MFLPAQLSENVLAAAMWLTVVVAGFDRLDVMRTWLGNWHRLAEILLVVMQSSDRAWQG